MSFQYTPELKTCVEAHEEAVVTQDEYRIKELFRTEKDLQFIVDCGANIGAASFKFQTFYPNSKILVCEPEPECMKLAKLNTGNKLTYVEKAIIGDNRKEVQFNVCKWAGNGHVDGHFRWDLFAPMGSKKVAEITVPACTLNDLMKEYDFPRIDLLKVDTEGMESEILKTVDLKKVKYIRGEWHGDVEKSLIREILSDTHDVLLESDFETHGGIFADLKPDLDKPKPLKENVKRGVVITTSRYTREFLPDLLESIKEVKYPVLVVSNDGYKPKVETENLIINDGNYWEMGGIQKGKETFDEFVHLMDTTIIKDTTMFDELFAIDGNVVLTRGNFHYMGKFETAKLPNLPIIDNKDTAIKLEAHWLKYYREFSPDLPVQSEVVETVHGQRRMRLENEFMIKWKGTWMREEKKEPF
ncbi:MAG: FkbM family methyltransferase [Candidatus Izemoplasmatales bacterium]|nr:FkbM family methyltransferase [Candidatus Izemoplasmatales bacterium]